MSNASGPFTRSMLILETVAAAGSGLSLNELAQRTGLPTSTTYRMATALVASGFLNREVQSGSFRTGPRLMRLAQYLLSQGSISAVTGPVLHELCERLQEAVFVTWFNGRSVELVAEALPVGSRSYVNPGRAFPINATASAKVLYAMQSREILDKALAVPLERFRPKTITDPDELRRHLAKVRTQGFATSEDELDAGVFSLACPIKLPNLGVIYALGAVGVRDSFLARCSRDEIAEVLRRGAALLAHSLGNQLGPSISNAAPYSYPSADRATAQEQFDTGKRQM